MVSFDSSTMKNIVTSSPIFSVKSICCIDFELASTACYLLKYIAIFL